MVVGNSAVASEVSLVSVPSTLPSPAGGGVSGAARAMVSAGVVAAVPCSTVTTGSRSLSSDLSCELPTKALLATTGTMAATQPPRSGKLAAKRVVRSSRRFIEPFPITRFRVRARCGTRFFSHRARPQPSVGHRRRAGECGRDRASRSARSLPPRLRISCRRLPQAN